MYRHESGQGPHLFAAVPLPALAFLPWLLWGCVDKSEPFTPFVRDGGHGDGDADSDSDADVDADGDADGDGDDDTCRSDDDCVLVVQSDVCCSCARAATITRDLLEQCLVRFPAEPDDVPPPCARECGACPDPQCAVPEAAYCRDDRCVLGFPGECLVDGDCGPGGTCEYLDGENVCVTSGDCTTHDECTTHEWCAPPDGLCTLMDAGRCVRTADCGDLPCEGVSAEAPGSCDEEPCDARACPQGYECLSVGDSTRCMLECDGDEDCTEPEVCLQPAIGAIAECIGADCAQPGGCGQAEMFCDDLDADGLNECVLYGECVYDGHCARKERCVVDPDTNGTICAPFADVCAVDEDCGPERTCVDADGDAWLDCQPSAGDCLVDDDCPGSRKVCRDFDGDGAAECANGGECARTLDCDEGDYCLRFEAEPRGECVQPGLEHCRGTVDCRANELCFDVDDDGTAECVSYGGGA
jgi:hypothetical protein